MMKQSRALTISSAVLATLAGCAMQTPQQDYKPYRYEMGLDPSAQYSRELNERDHEIALMRAQLTAIQETLYKVIQERNNLQVQVDSMTTASQQGANRIPVNRREDESSPKTKDPYIAVGTDTGTTRSPRTMSPSVSAQSRPIASAEEDRLQSDLYRALSGPGQGRLIKTSLTTSEPKEKIGQPPQKTEIVEYFDVLIRAESAEHLNKLDSFLSEHGVSDKFRSSKGNTYTLFLGTFSKVEFAAERRRKVGGISGIMPTIVRRVPGSV